VSVIPGDGNRQTASAARWETIRYAIDDNGRTIRLVMILLVPMLSAIVSLLIMVLASHYGLGPGSMPAPGQAGSNGVSGTRPVSCAGIPSLWIANHDGLQGTACESCSAYPIEHLDSIGMRNFPAS
jgi:hypothetical protein